MSEQNNQVQFVAVQFFTNSESSQRDDTDILSDIQFSLPSNEKSSSIDTDESTNSHIFIEPPPHQQPSLINEKIKPKSILHNLQKHLFTFLQIIIPSKALQMDADFNNKEVSKCVTEIFKLIKGQKTKTKEQLVPIFGQFYLQRISRINSTYRNLASQYSVSTLRQSFQTVKQFFLSQINPELIKQYLLKSKMNRKGEFEKYVESFIEEIKQGKFTSRLTKKSQNFIKETIKEEQKMNDWADVIV